MMCSLSIRWLDPFAFDICPRAAYNDRISISHIHLPVERSIVMATNGPYMIETLRQYIMSLHAEDEMEADGLSIYDVESALLTGKITERQKDRASAGSYGKGANLFVIENVPIVSCPHCGESYLTAETLHEIERIKLHRKALATERCIAVATFA
jgi:hypothetical protein